MIWTYFLSHILAFLTGFILDLLIGDPRGLIHPVQIIGALISKLDKALYSPDSKKALARGTLLVFITVALSVAVTAGILMVTYSIHIVAGFVAESLLTWSILAVKSLKKESMKVYYALADNDIKRARYEVSMIVGRDTDCLDVEGVTKACVETVAENTSDGVIAPMLYTAIGGPILGYFYKSINTMDSMIGYKNDRYLYFGRPAARLDDVVNFIPSRLSALFMIGAAGMLGHPFSAIDAIRIYRRDRNKSESPNASKCESVCAGALGIQLLGDAVYFGKVVKKHSIGDSKRPIEPEDINRTDRLMVATASLCFLLCTLIMIGAWVCYMAVTYTEIIFGWI